ncbi:MAG TPA: hypothetical protein VHO84_02370 [Syntrophorhabdaceae bacterium]|nr:hypothetical protein [Syntrophorhabdaceae bacterium]
MDALHDRKIMDTVALVELNRLWEPVRPYLIKQILDLYDREPIDIVEIGPFSGILFDLARQGTGSSFCMALFPDDILDSFQEESACLGLEHMIMMRKSDEKLSGLPTESFDLAIFRGAFFFPSLFQPDLTNIYRILRPGGMAIVGGGFGVHTPSELINHIGKRSADLNKQLGRIRVTKEDIQARLNAEQLEQTSDIIDDGGLWVSLRK